MPKTEIELLEEISKQTSEQMESIKSEFTTLVEKANKGTLNKEQLDEELLKLTKAADELTEKNKKDLTDQLNAKVKELSEKFELEILGLKEEGFKNNKSLTFRDKIKKAFEESGLVKEIETTEGKTKVIDYFSKKEAKSTPVMVIKAAVDMTTANIYSTNVELGSPFYTEYDLQVVQIPLNNDIKTMQVFPVRNVTTKYMGIIVENTYVDGSATTAENTAAGKSSVLFETSEFKVFKINTYFHIPEENLDDVDFLMDELGRLAPSKIMTKLDSKVLSTSGDNSTDIKGLLATGNHTDFDTTTYANSQEGADIIDLIGKMKLQADIANYSANVVIMHPNDIDVLEGLKDLNENSKYNRSVRYDATGNVTSVKGLKIVKNKQITADTMTVLDVGATTIGIRKDINMQIGLDSDDLTKGMRTVVFGMRAAFGVKDIGAVIYSDSIAADIAIINKD